MKLTLLGGFLFLGGCILFGSAIIASSNGVTSPLLQNISGFLAIVGLIIGIYSQFTKENKDK